MADETAQEAPAQEAPAQEAPAQEAPAQEAPAQEAPAQEAPAQEAPVQTLMDEDGEPTEDPVESEPTEDPVEYEDFALPEGMALDSDALGAFKDTAKELKLDQTQAQRLVDIAAGMQQRMVSQFVQQHVDTWLAWRDAVQNDGEYGGAALKDNLKVAREARAKYGTEALVKLFNETGIGDHPEVVRFFYRVGRDTSDHGFVKSGIPEKKTAFYDHPTSKPKG